MHLHIERERESRRGEGINQRMGQSDFRTNAKQMEERVMES